MTHHHSQKIQNDLRVDTYTFIRARVHLIPSENSEFLLIEVLCESRESLNALKDTIACIEFNRIDLAYQKQFNLIDLYLSCNLSSYSLLDMVEALSVSELTSTRCE